MPRTANTRPIALLIGGSLLALTTPAFAQDAAPQEDPSALEDIIVTAQKREQNLQDVPIAISAIGAERLDQIGVRDSRDLSGLAPNVTITQGTTSGAAAVISIRGIPTPASETFGLDTANGLYIDGVYIGRSGASGLDVMDIERVEVLRGPQGTLFGRNTTGGAISFISRAPSEEFRARAEIGFGNFGARTGRVTIDPGEFMGIATSFSYSRRVRDGLVDNILQPNDRRDPGARESDAFRIAARVELGGTGSVQYIFDWSRLESSPMPFQLTNVADGTVRPPVVVNGQPVVVTQQAPVAPYLAAVTFLQPGCAALSAPTRRYRDTVCNDILGFSVDKTWGHNFQVENDFGDFAVRSVTGYRFWNNDSNSDLDGIGAFRGPAFSNATLFNSMPVSLLQFIPTIPAPARPIIAASPVPTVSQNLFDTNNQRRHRQFSQEIEISGDSSVLDWVVGGFYFWEKGSEINPQNSGFVLDTNSIFLANFGPLGPLFVAANPARYRLVQTRSVLRYTATSESTALYAQATFYPGGRDSGIRLTAGGRYTWDNKQMFRTQNGAALLAVPESGQASFSKFTWNLMLGYDLADGITAYARAATGYRSGGFNAQDAAITGTTTLPNFNEENVTSYEVGLKTELFDRRVRLNIAGYHNIYRDLAALLPLTDAPPGTFATRIGNAGRVTYTGFEVELQAILTDNFSVDGSLGYVDINYKSFRAGQSTTPNAPAVDIGSISSPAYTSPLTANVGLNANFPLNWGDARVVGRVSYTYEDGKTSFTNILATPFNDVLRGDDRNIIDAQLGIEGIPLAGNVTGDLRFWVRNLTDANDFVRGIDFGQLGYAGGYYAEPRTYGMTFGVRF